jgi:hypothetical protein
MVWVFPLDSMVWVQVLFCLRMVWYGLPSLDAMTMVHSWFLMQDCLVRWDLCRLDCVEGVDHPSGRAGWFNFPNVIGVLVFYLSVPVPS